MTLVEFVAPILNKPNRDKVLAVLYYCHRYKKVESLTVEEIRSELKSARIPRHNKINVADVLNKSGHYVDSPGLSGTKRLWTLTQSGNQYIRDLLGLPASDPEIEHDISSLSKILGKVRNPEIKGFIEEALKCLSVDALRACVVFLWSGAIHTIHEKMLKSDKTKLNAALQKHDSKARNVTRIDHFAYVKDRISLLAASELGVIDKNEKDVLEEALGLRNKCGHPGKYKPGPKKVSSYIEDLITVVFK